MTPPFGHSHYMLLAEADQDQMVLFDVLSDEGRHEVLSPGSISVPASAQHSAVGVALGLVMVLILWLPIALLFWLLT